MSEETNAADRQAEPNAEPHGEEPKADIDWKAEARKWESRAKENRSAAESQAAEAERIKAEADRARADAEAAKAEADRLKAEKARAEAVKRASADHGVDADLLALMSGDTPEEIESNAGVLKAKLSAMPIYPNAPDNGAGSPETVTKKQIMSIKNPTERIGMMAKHSGLFK